LTLDGHQSEVLGLRTALRESLQVIDAAGDQVGDVLSYCRCANRKMRSRLYSSPAEAASDSPYVWRKSASRASNVTRLVENLRSRNTPCGTPVRAQNRMRRDTRKPCSRRGGCCRPHGSIDPSR
jgi:hypothetical protein